MNGDTLDNSGNLKATCHRCLQCVTPRQWGNCERLADCPQNWPPGPLSAFIKGETPAAAPVPAKCPNDTNGDGDCQICRDQPAGCPVAFIKRHCVINEPPRRPPQAQPNRQPARSGGGLNTHGGNQQ